MGRSTADLDFKDSIIPKLEKEEPIEEVKTEVKDE